MKLSIFAVLLIALAVSCAPAETEPEPPEAPEAAGQAPAAVPTGTRESPFVGHGVIVEIGEDQLIIQHDTIPGFMAAMTMEFPTAEEVMIEELETGDEIMFDIEMLGDAYQIFGVETMEAEGEEDE